MKILTYIFNLSVLIFHNFKFVTSVNFFGKFIRLNTKKNIRVRLVLIFSVVIFVERK